MRVRICPINATTLFYWNDNNNMEIEEKYRHYLCSKR